MGIAAEAVDAVLCPCVSHHSTPLAGFCKHSCRSACWVLMPQEQPSANGRQQLEDTVGLICSSGGIILGIVCTVFQSIPMGCHWP